MTEPPTTRSNADGFKGEYPPPLTAGERAYRQLGLTPPWLLEYKDGKVVGRREQEEPPVPDHEA